MATAAVWLDSTGMSSVVSVALVDQRRGPLGTVAPGGGEQQHRRALPVVAFPRRRFGGIGRHAPDRTLGHRSADLLRQLDDDARRPAHVAQPVAVLVVTNSPTCSPPCARRAPRDASMSSTTNRTWRMPGALGGAGPSSPSYEGDRYLASSSWLPPPGVCSITMSACTPSSPLMRSTKLPPTDASPSTSSPSATKNAVAAARSSTTMPMCSRRWTVMNGLRPAPAACTRRACVPTSRSDPAALR